MSEFFDLLVNPEDAWDERLPRVADNTEALDMRYRGRRRLGFAVRAWGTAVGLVVAAVPAAELGHTAQHYTALGAVVALGAGFVSHVAGVIDVNAAHNMEPNAQACDDLIPPLNSSPLE